MTIRFWGTRGSIPSIDENTLTFGGNTSCVSIVDDGQIIILDGGSGIKRLGDSNYLKFFNRFHIFLTHYHLDHILGLGFFAPFFNPNNTITIYGPAANSEDLMKTLNKYLSPPLFPVRIKDFSAKVDFISMPNKNLKIGPFDIDSAFVCHPGPTLGYRVSTKKYTIAYIPDHEVALGVTALKPDEWVSGFSIAKNADVLIHDAQYSTEEYDGKVGWGHSSYHQTIDFAKRTKVKKLYFFHHDPGHTDQRLQELHLLHTRDPLPFEAHLAKEADTVELD
ncbi:MAG: MBL fold metallo-hydrolase [Saprospiraceae bacterium]